MYNIRAEASGGRGVITLYGVGRYELRPPDVRVGQMDSIRLYDKIGTARGYRTRQQKRNTSMIKTWGASPSLPAEEWVLFTVVAPVVEIP